MERRKNREVLQGVFFSKFFFIFCSVLVILVLVGITKGVLKGYYVRTEIDQLRQQIAAVEKKNREFTQLISYLQSPDFVEQEAKLKMGLKKEREGVVIVPDAAIVTPTTAAPLPDTRNNLQRWIEYFSDSRPL